MNRKKMTITRIAYDAVLAAMCAVLGYVSLDFGVFKFTFENLPVLIGALLFGPIDGMLVGGVGTFLYQLLKYGLEASTPLWILPYVISGLFAGLCAKGLKYNIKLWQMLVIVIADGIIVTAMNTVSLYVTYKYLWLWPVETVIAKIPFRVVVSVIKSVVFAVVLPYILKALRKVTGHIARENAEKPNNPREEK